MVPKTKTPAVCRPLVWFLWCRTWKTETPLDRSEASISRPQKQQHWPVIRFLGSGQQSKQLQPLLQWASSEEEWEFCALGSSQFQQQLLWRKNPIWDFELPGFGFGSALCQSQFFEPCKEWDSWKGIWLSDFSGLKWATHLNLSGNTKLKKETNNFAGSTSYWWKFFASKSVHKSERSSWNCPNGLYSVLMSLQSRWVNNWGSEFSNSH